MQDLDQIIQLCRSSCLLQLQSENSEEGAILQMLGWALGRRHDRTGTVADLDEAVECYGRALSISPPGHSQNTACLNGLGYVLF